MPDPQLKGCSSEGYPPDEFYRLFAHPEPEFETVTCRSINVSANRDISGALLSLAMQSGILAFIHFAVLILKFFPGVTRCIRHRHFSALKFTLVEFQEAQCFYMLSFQFTALTALVAGPQLYKATSLAQLTSNTSMVKTVTLMGVLPITHGL
ncbi:hypothetical protein BDV37DRAFT_96784 [Aspergillus pseudonomiae]|uniref:Uncharacterized protein n=1 Tax=Aspergillus pseudonomiae TaxID=1506151 RepID=A0A5N7CRJ9_9EURO|nr:uncharacterized protein BDV37DRAFT_96784 [Aspergillus pseudonomiae]KAE8396816.1 hypothetical protein BDV37DRAFT_96784 [Aspergillus pseudonomiae]